MDHPELEKAEHESRIMEIREPTLLEKGVMIVKAYWIPVGSTIGILICVWHLIRIGALSPI